LSPHPSDSPPSSSYLPFFSSQIIAILAAILFPVFARAREKARQASCLSNVKQLGLGLLMYVQDYDEKMPVFEPGWGITPSPPETGCSWWQGIYPYVKNYQLYVCPNANEWGPFTYWGRIFATFPSYGLNANARGRKLGQINAPAQFMVLGDCCHPMGDAPWRFAWPNAPGGYPDKCTTAETQQDPRWAPHSGGSNYCFADGHAKWLNANSFWADRNTYWNP